MSDNFHHIFGTTFLGVHHIFGTTFCGVHHIFVTTLQRCIPILEYSPLLLFYLFYPFTFFTLLLFYSFTFLLFQLFTLKISKNPTPLACFR